MITLESKWEELYTLPNWLQWLALAQQHDTRLAEYWRDCSACEQCIHIDPENAWCKLCEAPATRNPVLNCIGMACCGMLIEKVGQQELFEGFDF